MPYQQITVNVNDAVAERLADALMEHGALSAAIEDAYAGTQNEQAIFGEPGMPAEQIWQQSKVIALFGEHDEAAAIIQIAAQECGLKDLAYTGETIEDQDWVRLTQSQFDPIRISDRLWITPSWHEVPEGSAVNLRLDPGLAFGTGSHPTTRLCLKWLDTQLKNGESVLDYGCGSGILTIAARTKQGGRIVLSGLLDEQAEELGGIYSQWFDLDPAETEESWARLSGTKR
ncbi:TPA: 50S ribosomal protein L11 methyltransferase [Neisseria meningitidis]